MSNNNHIAFVLVLLLVGCGQTNINHSGLSVWTGETAALSSQWRAVAWSPKLNLWAALSIEGHAMTSPDGKAWTARPSNSAGWHYLIWSDRWERFIGVASSVNIGDQNKRVIVSSDGTNWTLNDVPELNQWRSITESKSTGALVALAIDGTNRVMRSVDGGDTWTAVPAAEQNSWEDITYDSRRNRFVAVATTGTNRVMYSDDEGLTWTAIPATELNEWTAITYVDTLDKLVALAHSGNNRGMTSVDGGETWTAHAVTMNTWYDIQLAPEFGVLGAVSLDGRFGYSVNGETWTTLLLPESGAHAALGWSPELGRFASVCMGGVFQVNLSGGY